MSAISSKLRQLREQKGWTKTYIYKVLNLGSMQTYANWEYGRTEPDSENISKLATLFGVSTDYLLGHDTPSNSSETDLDRLIDNAHSYDGKPITGRDRDVIKAFLKGLYTNN